jgi:hypothetical protein
MVGSPAANFPLRLSGSCDVPSSSPRGSIEVRKLADLVVLNGLALENIRATADARYVVKAGTRYDARSLDRLWPKSVPFGPTYWVNDDVLQTNIKGTDPFDKPKKPSQRVVVP